MCEGCLCEEGGKKERVRAMGRTRRYVIPTVMLPFSVTTYLPGPLSAPTADSAASRPSNWYIIATAPGTPKVDENEYKVPDSLYLGPWCIDLRKRTVNLHNIQCRGQDAARKGLQIRIHDHPVMLRRRIFTPRKTRRNEGLEKSHD